jgi:iron complex transport system substrate-binding protein
MKNKYALVFCITILITLVTGCSTTPAPTDMQVDIEPASTPVESQAEPTPDVLVLEDGLGRMISFDSPPRRIISLAPSNTEILFAVGAAGQVVGRDEYSDYPTEALEVTSIGDTYGELNTEAIVTLEPDLILVAEITPIEQIEALNGLGLKVFQIANPMTFEDLFVTLETVAKITGWEETAVDLIDALRARVTTVETTVAEATRVRVFYEVDGSDPTAPWTTGAGTFQQVLIEMVKGENIAGDLEGWGPMNLEQIVERDPEVILFGEGPWVPTTSESIAERTGWARIDAVVNGRVYGVDTNWIDRPGPRLVDALERFAEVVQPDLFK